MDYDFSGYNKLIDCRLAARRPKSGGGDELDPVGQAPSHGPHAFLNDVLTRLALPLFFMVITFLYLLLKN